MTAGQIVSAMSAGFLITQGSKRDPYDIERFQRIRDISAEMVSEIGDLPLDLVKAAFCAGTGYQTPKQDTRAAVIRDGKILLVQEASGQWALRISLRLLSARSGDNRLRLLCP